MSFNKYGSSQQYGSTPNQQYAGGQQYSPAGDSGGRAKSYFAAQQAGYDPTHPYINLPQQSRYGGQVTPQRSQYSNQAPAQQQFGTPTQQQGGGQGGYNPNYPSIGQSQYVAQSATQYQGYQPQHSQYAAPAQVYPGGGQAISAETSALLTQLQTQLGGKPLGSGVGGSGGSGRNLGDKENKKGKGRERSESGDGTEKDGSSEDWGLEGGECGEVDDYDRDRSYNRYEKWFLRGRGRGRGRGSGRGRGGFRG